MQHPHASRTKIALVAAAVLAGALVPVTVTPAAARPARCDSLVQGFYDRSPLTGGVAPGLWNYRLAQATHCLINAERAKVGAPPLMTGEQTGGPLINAADAHARAAVTLKWWGENKDSHTNPQTGSTPESRIRGEGFCAQGRTWAVYEITHTGWGGNGTPREAVKAWMASKGDHPKIIKDPALTWIGVSVVPGAADPAGNGWRDAATSVVTFGYCRQ
ncbi:CAP domain-containing protein [Streptomyces sp. LARHCF249]